MDYTRNMNQYIATFYAHFGAIRYKKLLSEKGIEAKVMPVPRFLSSSCGTCVSYHSEDFFLVERYKDEVEQIVLMTGEGCSRVYEPDC